MVCEYPDGRVEIRHQGAVLPYRVFDKLQRMNQAAIVDSKHLGGALTLLQEMQDQRPPLSRPRRGPRRSTLPATVFQLPNPDAGDIGSKSVPNRTGKPPPDISTLRRL